MKRTDTICLSNHLLYLEIFNSKNKREPIAASSIALIIDTLRCAWPYIRNS